MVQYRITVAICEGIGCGALKRSAVAAVNLPAPVRQTLSKLPIASYQLQIPGASFEIVPPSATKTPRPANRNRVKVAKDRKRKQGIRGDRCQQRDLNGCPPR